MHSSLAPGLLAAGPPLVDPHFVHALILLVVHNEEGALGIVVNSAQEVACVGDLLEQLDLTDDPTKHPSPVRSGGPVQPEIGWIVYQPSAEPLEGEIKLSAGVAVTQSREVLASIGRDVGPGVYSAYLGYTGWAPGQLENEIAQGAWLPLSLDDSIVFDVPVEERWKTAYARAGVAPAGFMSTRKGTA